MLSDGVYASGISSLQKYLEDAVGLSHHGRQPVWLKLVSIHHGAMMNASYLVTRSRS